LFIISFGTPINITKLRFFVDVISVVMVGTVELPYLPLLRLKRALSRRED